jgi:general secretion pathway protein C
LTADTQLNPWVNRANALVCAALVVASAFVLVKLVYLFVDTSVGTAPVVYGSQSATGIMPSQLDKVDTSAIAMWSLFGKEGQAPVKTTQPEDVEAPETRLSLELQAVFVAPVEERSTAMIAESRRDSELYHVGDKVPGNVTLAAVYQDRVLLNRSGKLETLYFPENAKGGLSRGSSNANSRSRTNRSSKTASSRNRANGRAAFGVPPGSSNAAAKSAQAAMADQMISTLREQIEQDPGELLGQFGLATNNGRGYRVSENANPMLAAVGAKSGDVVLAINGRNLGDPVQDVSLIEDVMQDGTVRVSIERNGRQFESEVALPGL